MMMSALTLLCGLLWTAPVTPFGLVSRTKSLSASRLGMQTKRNEHASRTESEIRRDIQELQSEALRRMDALSEQMEELKQENDASKGSSDGAHSFVSADSPADLLSSLDSCEGTFREQQATDQVEFRQHEKDAVLDDMQTSTQQPKTVDHNLLDDTRWKVVFNVGREQGTWMPDNWAVSGERLRFQATLDLTSEVLEKEDDFFGGQNADNTKGKVVNVVESFVFPHGTIGRKPLKVKETGGYKVIPGQGPFGTDIVRMYVELEEEIENGDVTCPGGRVYGTCGYFSMDNFHHAADTKTLKEQAQEDLKKASEAHDELKATLENDDLSWGWLVNMKKLMDSTENISKMKNRYREARQREPELSEIRPSRNGNVALSREGGVCCKIDKGLAFEYHILGRMELASVDVRDSHDNYQELIQKLRP